MEDQTAFDYCYDICVIGCNDIGGSGVTKLLKFLGGEIFNDHFAQHPTQGVESTYVQIVHSSGAKINIRLWEFGSKQIEKYVSSVGYKTYLKRAVGVIFCYDVVDHNSIEFATEKIQNWFPTHFDRGIIGVLAGNKIDIPEQRKVTIYYNFYSILLLIVILFSESFHSRGCYISSYE